MLAETFTSQLASLFLTPGLATSLQASHPIILLCSQSTKLHGTGTAACTCAGNVTVIDRNGQLLTVVLGDGISHGKLWGIPE